MHLVSFSVHRVWAWVISIVIIARTNAEAVLAADAFFFPVLHTFLHREAFRFWQPAKAARLGVQETKNVRRRITQGGSFLCWLDDWPTCMVVGA